jgi:hypothetical protein
VSQITERQSPETVLNITRGSVGGDDIKPVTTKTKVMEFTLKCKVVTEGGLSYWAVSFNGGREKRHENIVDAILLTGICFGDRRIAVLHAQNLGHYSAK